MEQGGEHDQRRALGHPVRVAMLRQLKGGRVASVTELAEDADLPISQASYHLLALQQAEAVEVADTQHDGDAVIRYFRSTPRGDSLRA